MKTFSREEKEKVIVQVQAHYDADEIIKGVYWEDGKGCAIGCLVHDQDHLKAAKLLGVSEEIAYVIDEIFEGLPNGEAKKFPLQLVKSIPPGKDLSMLWPQFALALLVDPKIGVIRFVQDQKYAQQKQSIQAVADLYRQWVDTGRKPAKDLFAAARAAAWAARAAAAAWAAGAAAWASRDAVWAAGNAAVDAARAAGNAAREMQWIDMRDLLLRLIEDGGKRK